MADQTIPSIKNLRGNIGIGTATPEAKLDIKTASSAWNVGAGFNDSVVRISGEADGTNQGGLGLSYTNSGGAIIGSIQHGNDYKAITMSGRTFMFEYGSATPRLFINSAGKVGIGTTSPSTIFQVNTGDASGNKFGLTGDGSTTGAALWTNWTTGSSYLDFRLGGTSSTYTKMRILNNGKVGIGTTSPALDLHVDGKVRVDHNDGVAARQIRSGYFSSGQDLTLTSGSAAAVKLKTGSTVQVTVNHDGNVGIGTTTPDYKLEVDGGDFLVNTNNGGYVQVDESDNSLKLSDNVRLKAGTNNDLHFYHNSTNNISFIENHHANGLRIKSDELLIFALNGSTLRAEFNTAVKLLYNDAYKFETTDDGAKVTGNLLLNSAHYVHFGDSTARIQGSNASNYLKFYTGGAERLSISNLAASFSGNVVISGGLTVQGTTTTINSTTVSVDDKNIELGTVATPTDLTADGGGITLKGASDYTINWSNSTDSWHFNQGITVGENGTGHDVVFYGDTSDRYLTWDQSADKLHLRDNVKATFGDGDDLQIFHDGSNSYIRDNGTGGLVLEGSTLLELKARSGEVYLRGTENGSVKLYHNNAGKLETGVGGIFVTGKMTSDTIATGYANSLEMFSSGTNNFISSESSGSHLFIRNVGGGSTIIQGTTNENAIVVAPNGAVTLYHDNATRLSTTTDGISLSGNGYIDLPDNGRARFGDSYELAIYHNGANNGFIHNTTPYLVLESDNIILRNTASNEDYAKFLGNGAVELYYNNSKKFETTNDGIQVDGYVKTKNSKYKKYTSLSGSSNDWFPIYQVNDHKGGQVTFTVNTYAHSSCTFVVSEGYGPSGQSGNPAHINVLNYLYHPNGGYANITGIRVNQIGMVEIKLTFTSGPNVSVAVRIESSEELQNSLASSLATSTSTEAIRDTVILSNGYARFKNLTLGSDGTVSLPALNFGSSGSTGLYYDNANSALRLSVGGSQRAYFASGGIFSTANVYTGTSGQFRNYGGTWQATTGTGTNGFIFKNTNEAQIAATITSKGTLTLNGGTTSTKLYLYETYTDASNYERTTFEYSSGYLNIDANKAGSGTTSGIKLGANGYTFLQLEPEGNVLINGANDNSNKADFAVGVGGSPRVSWHGTQVQIGGTDMNYNGNIMHDGIFRMQSYNANISFECKGGAGSGVRDIIFRPFNDSADTEAMRIKGNGDVGIGTSNPVSITSLVRSLTLNGTHSSVGGGIVYQVNGSTKAYHYVESNLLRHQAQSGVGQQFYTNGSESMRIQSNGNVGIATTSPAHRLDVVGTYRISDNTTNANNKLHRMLGRHYTNAEQDVNIFSSISTSSTNVVSFGGGSSSYNTATHILFYTASNNTSTYAVGQERFRIHNDGNIGIAVGSPQQKLDVDGAIKSKIYTVNTLPTANSSAAGARAFVSDSQMSASGNFGATIAGYGSGSYTVPVWCDGSYWYIG